MVVRVPLVAEISSTYCMLCMPRHIKHSINATISSHPTDTNHNIIYDLQMDEWYGLYVPPDMIDNLGMTMLNNR